jgi:hypothetical protein
MKSGYNDRLADVLPTIVKPKGGKLSEGAMAGIVFKIVFKTKVFIVIKTDSELPIKNTSSGGSLDICELIKL